MSKRNVMKVRIMTARTISPAISLAAILFLAACGSSAGPGAPPNDYLATGSGWVDYIQWDSSGTGTLTSETLTGTAPDETVQSNQTPITVTVNGSQVEFSGLNPQTGTLNNGVLTLQVLASDGTLGTDTFTPAGQADFNKAVGALQAQAASDNSAALQQQAQASQAQASASAADAQASANAQAEQTAQNDLSTLQGVSFSSDLGKLASDVSQTNSDLAKEKSDAAAGVDGPGGPPCYNLEQNVDYDATQNVEYDATQNLGYDLQQNLSPDISTARSDIATLNTRLSHFWDATDRASWRRCGQDERRPGTAALVDARSGGYHRVPAPRQASEQVLDHLVVDVGVVVGDVARRAVAEALASQHLGDPVAPHRRLVAVPQAVRGEAGRQLGPRAFGHLFRVGPVHALHRTGMPGSGYRCVDVGDPGRGWPQARRPPRCARACPG